MRVLAALGVAALAACQHDVPAPPATAPPPKVVAPTRGAAGDTDLRVMLSELVSSHACEKIRGNFLGLRAPDHPDVVTGVLWIRECDIANVGLRVTFRIAGNGWTWVDQTSGQGGGTFVVRQYVRFSIAATIRGELDVAYDRTSHVATVWFTPNVPSDLEFKTIGGIEVDRQGAWSSVIGALGETFASSPDDVASTEATKQGTRDLGAQLTNGLAVSINLCTGLSRVHLGHPKRGDMGMANVGETRRVPVDLKPGGVMIIGPQGATRGVTLQAEATQGGVSLAVVCAKHAETVAAEFMAGKITSAVPRLGTVEVRTKSRLRIKPTACPVVVVVSPLDNAPARFAWERPTAEIARSTGGPLIRCESRAKPKR